MASKVDRKARQAREREQHHKALAHPRRVDIMTYFIDHSTGSPSQIARVIGAPVKDVDRHMKQLVRYESAELVEERPTTKGSPEHIYRATRRPLLDDDAVEKMTPPAREGFARQIVEKIAEDLEDAAAARLLSKRADWVLTRTPLQLDEEGRQELHALHERLLEESLEVEARSNARRAKSGEEAKRLSTCQLLFELPEQS